MRLVLIYLLVLLCGMSSASAQEVTNAYVLECFEEFFVIENFDSIYYTHKDAKHRSFFVLREGSIEEILNDFPKDKNLFELKNGNLMSINPKGLMFVWGIRYYLKFTKNIITDRECLIAFEGIDFNGFTEKVLEQREMKFVKEKGHWKKVCDRKL